MKYTVVLPWIWLPYKDEYMATAKWPAENLLLVDNTEKNRGIPRSHNMGIDKMYRDGADWLIIQSAALRFGQAGGLDFIDNLEKFGKEGFRVMSAQFVCGWHMIAFHREVLDKVGRWDENLGPYGPSDDGDLSVRINKAYGKQYNYLCCQIPVKVRDMGPSHSTQLAGLRVDNTQENIEYFKTKWGGYGTGDAKECDINKLYDQPFNDPNNSIKYWPKVEGKEPWQGGSFDERIEL